jgi:hypothetical protein
LPWIGAVKLGTSNWRAPGAAKESFAGPEAVLAFVSRYTHRVAVSNSRLLPSAKFLLADHSM